MNWALVISLLAAIGSCSAAIAAVAIATCDRRERKAERVNAAKTQATLVLLDVKLSWSGPGFYVFVRNLGMDAILDVEVDSAHFKRVPDAKFNVTNRLGPSLKVVEVGAAANQNCLIVEFVDSKGDSVITGTRDGHNQFVAQNAEPSDLDVKLRFMDSEGHYWRRSQDSVELAKW